MSSVSSSSSRLANLFKVDKMDDCNCSLIHCHWWNWPSVCNPSVGTAIDQGEAPEFYFQKYPEENPVWGFFTWRWVLTLGLDHMFSSPIFLGMLVLLATSLMACTYTTQIPLVKAARRFDFSATSSHLLFGICWRGFLLMENPHIQMEVFAVS